jgi:uncharacterized membrane protein YfcA
MIKKIAMAALAVAVVSVSTVGAIVHAAPGHTDVTGVVTENFVAVAGASVTVLCNGNTETDTTDASGSYLVSYLTAQCPFGSTVKVTAMKNGKSGTSSGTVTGITTKLNLAIVNVSIPEYGLIGTLFAGGAGLGLIGYMRRRQQRSQL